MNLTHILNDLAIKLGTSDNPAPARDLGRALGISHVTVNDWREGKYTPKLETVNNCIKAVTLGLEALLAIRELLVAPPVVARADAAQKVRPTAS